MHTIKDTVKLVHVKTPSDNSIPIKNYVAQVLNLEDGDVVVLPQIMLIVRCGLLDQMMQSYYGEWCKNEIPTLTDVVDEDRQHNQLMNQVDRILNESEKAIKQSEGFLQQAKDEWDNSNSQPQQSDDKNESKSIKRMYPHLSIREMWKKYKKFGG